MDNNNSLKNRLNVFYLYIHMKRWYLNGSGCVCVCLFMCVCSTINEREGHGFKRKYQGYNGNFMMGKEEENDRIITKFQKAQN